MTARSSIETKIKEPSLFATGLALFSMFFGAGNLIFPLLVGKEAGSQAPFALLGLTISAILFPLLGLLAMLIFEGNVERFLQRLGKVPALLLLFSLQVAQGPLGLSRLYNLMYASIKSYIPFLSLPAFTLLLSCLVFVIAYRSHRLITLVGKVLTPFLIASTALLIVAGWIFPSSEMVVSKEGAGYHFFQGLKGGYMTLDLIAAILFSTVIIPQFAQGGYYKTQEQRKAAMRKKMLGASCVAAFLLALTYLGLTLLSSRHGAALAVAPESLLQAIAVKVLGPVGASIAATAVFFACLTTAVALAAVFAKFLRKDVFNEKIGSPFSLGITVMLAAAIANLGFSKVLQLVGPFFEILYPALIVLCLCNIAYSLYQVKWIKTPVFAALAFGAVRFFLKVW